MLDFHRRSWYTSSRHGNEMISQSALKDQQISLFSSGLKDQRYRDKSADTHEREALLMHPMIRLAREKYVNKKFGRLLVLEYMPGNAKQKLHPRVVCLCNCGETINIRLDVLSERGATGCTYSHGKRIGKKFGRLTVVDYEPGKWIGDFCIRYARAICVCECDPDKTISVHMTALLSGKQVSCGCYHRDQHTTHGMSKTLEYVSWQHMKSRCLNPRFEQYKDYGGRGIKVCERWLNSFENFFADMGQMPSENHTMGRINNDGNYTPENCEWQTHYQQSRIKRSTHSITFGGRTQCLMDWALEIGISFAGLHNRLTRWKSIERALTTPVQRKK